MHKIKLAKTYVLSMLMATGGVIALGGPKVYAADPCKDTRTPENFQKCVNHNQIITDLQNIVNALSIGVAIIVVVMIIVGGVQYAAAGDSPEAVSKAKKRITNALIALLAFIFLDAFIQWLVPGGVFG
jgi:hypothetical protein